MKKIASFAWEIIKIFTIAAVIVFPIRYFLFQPFLVRGESMMPNFSEGDYLIVDEISYRFKDPARGEVVVFKYPDNLSQRFIKRVIGLPGETIEVEKNKITIYNEEKEEITLSEGYLFLNNFSGSPAEEFKIILEENEYFLMGDHRLFSFDSRRFGPIKRNMIIGRVIIRAWPFSDFSFFESPYLSK